MFPQWFHTPAALSAIRGRNPDTWGQMTWMWKQRKTSSLELPRCWYHWGHARNLGMDTTINGPKMYCIHSGQWSRIRAVPVNDTALISMLNYLLCKSSLASEIAVRDHMYHNEIYFSCSLPPVLIWTNIFGTPCIREWFLEIELEKSNQFNQKKWNSSKLTKLQMKTPGNNST